jgi:hypothetical protein
MNALRAPALDASAVAVPPSIAVALPSNITPIDTQADLYGYGVAMFGYLEVTDEADAVERAEGRDAFLLKSKTLPVYYLIFPHVIISAEKGK